MILKAREQQSIITVNRSSPTNPNVIQIFFFAVKMFKARQNLVNQRANLHLVEIRKAELTYFTNFFSVFATQCVLLTTFEMSAISQLPPDRTNTVCGADCPFYVLFPSAIFLTTSVAVNGIIILTAVYVTAFANGLAIHGKQGAILDAIKGMIAEQSKVVKLFLFTCFLFQAQFFCAYFILMERLYSFICGGIMIFCALWTYRASLRIYNNFYFDERHAGWKYDQEKPEEEESLSQLNPDLIEDLMKTSRLHNPEPIHAAYKRSLQKGLLQETDSAEKKRNILLEILSSAERMTTTVRESISKSVSFSGRPSLPAFPTFRRSISESQAPPLPVISSLENSYRSSLSNNQNINDNNQNDNSNNNNRESESSFGGNSIRSWSIYSSQAQPQPSQQQSHPTGPRSSLSQRPSSLQQPQPQISTDNNRDSTNPAPQQSRPSFQYHFRSSLGAIGNSFSYVPNPLNFRLSSQQFPSQPQQQQQQTTHRPNLPSYSVGALTVKIVPPNRNNSRFFFSWTSSSSSQPQSEKWMDYYFILKGGLLFYYENETSFLTAPQQPLNKENPIDLRGGYELKKGPSEPPFAFTLRPLSSVSQLKTWSFRCSEENVFDYWTERIEEKLEEIHQQELMKEFM
jgi:hypothetical protein